MNRKVKVIAHRGASSMAPENTLSAIRKAMELGVDVIEIDVRQTKDGVPVVIHDKSVNRTTNGKGLLKKMTLKSLKELDAGSWFAPAFRTERIPTLEEVIQLIDGKCELLIEVKNGHDTYPGIAKNILDVIKKHNTGKWCIVQSFDNKVLKQMFREDVRVELHKLIVADFAFLPAYFDFGFRIGKVYRNQKTQGINANYRYLTPKMIRKIHNSGHKVYTWTVDDPILMKKYVQMGVDGIVTNFPERLLAILSDNR